MKFLISEARRKKSVLFLSGYFYPETEVDAEDLANLISSDEKYHFSNKENIKLDKGTIYIQNVTCNKLALILKTICGITFSPEPEENIRYIGNINEEGLSRELASMLVGWGSNKTV